LIGRQKKEMQLVYSPDLGALVTGEVVMRAAGALAGLRLCQS